MAYDAKLLTVLNYSDGFTMWLYKGKEEVRYLTKDGFFNEAFEVLRVGDIIITPQVNGMLIVKSKHTDCYPKMVRVEKYINNNYSS